MPPHSSKFLQVLQVHTSLHINQHNPLLWLSHLWGGGEMNECCIRKIRKTANLLSSRWTSQSQSSRRDLLSAVWDDQTYGSRTRPICPCSPDLYHTSTLAWCTPHSRSGTFRHCTTPGESSAVAFARLRRRTAPPTRLIRRSSQGLYRRSRAAGCTRSCYSGTGAGRMTAGNTAPRRCRRHSRRRRRTHTPETCTSGYDTGTLQKHRSERLWGTELTNYHLRQSKKKFCC